MFVTARYEGNPSEGVLFEFKESLENIDSPLNGKGNGYHPTEVTAVDGPVRLV